MSDTAEKLRQELQAAQRAVAELQAQLESRETTHRLTTLELEENRSALLFMLEDLEKARKKIEQAHQEWMAALDVVEDPTFLHDKQFRILRCNKAYQRCAGIPFKQIIGHPYYEIFPKAGAPLPCCLRAMEKAEEEEEEEVAVGDAIYRSRAFSIHDEQGVYLYSVHTLENITERKRIESDLGVNRAELEMQNEALRQAQIALEESRDQFVDLYEFSPVGYLTLSHEEMIDKINLTATALLGVERNKLWHHRFAPFVATEDRDRWHRHLLNVLQHDGQQRCELALRRSDDSVFHAQLDCLHMKAGGASSVRVALTDITERKKAEEELRLRAQLLDSVSDTIFVLDLNGTFIYLNEAAWKTRGYTRDEMMGIDLHVLDTPKYEKLIESRMRDLMEKGRCIFESEHRRKDGSVMPVEINARVIELGGRKLVLSVIRDITERNQAEDKLRESEERHRQIIQTSMDGFWVTDTKGHILDVNDAYCQLTGYAREELLNMCIADMEAKETPEETAQHVQDIMAKGHARFESRHRRKDGQLLDIEVSVVHRTDKEGGHLFVFLHDITERKRAEAAIQHANRALATLSAVNRTLVRAASEDDLLQSICQAIVRQRSYRMAWVGYTQRDESKSIKIMAHAGHDEGYLDAMQLTWAETERGMGPSGRAVRSGTTQLCHDMANDPLCLPWRDAAQQHGYAASIALPLLNGDNTVFGILNVYAEEVIAFTPGEIDLLEEMAGDLAFGVRTLHIRHERDLVLVKNREQLVQLQDSLEDTVRAMAAIVEMRDPYTAGHQSRVADLAVAIARKIGLPDEHAHAIHLAGVVHDLGKIQIPAEILSKPGKISDIEYSLIKIHPQAGYDILKGIDFPWPIAQMVLQHHERLDGSGYPQGLKGDAILLGARILAVADVVEAISAHRPYRPGLGVEVALEEITKQRGIHFDPAVVDACLALFREQSYSFEI